MADENNREEAQRELSRRRGEVRKLQTRINEYLDKTYDRMSVENRPDPYTWAVEELNGLKGVIEEYKQYFR